MDDERKEEARAAAELCDRELELIAAGRDKQRAPIQQVVVGGGRASVARGRAKSRH